jgi:hypothetical protein
VRYPSTPGHCWVQRLRASQIIPTKHYTSYLSNGRLGENPRANDASPTSSPDNYRTDYVRAAPLCRQTIVCRHTAPTGRPDGQASHVECLSLDNNTAQHWVCGETSTLLGPLKSYQSHDWGKLYLRGSTELVYPPFHLKTEAHPVTDILFISYLEFRTMGKAHKPNGSVIHHRQNPSTCTWYKWHYWYSHKFYSVLTMLYNTTICSTGNLQFVCRPQL